MHFLKRMRYRPTLDLRFQQEVRLEGIHRWGFVRHAHDPMVHERKSEDDDCQQRAFIKVKKRKRVSVKCVWKCWELSLTFLHNWKTANANEMMKEKNDNWSAFHAFKPSTPRASGTRVMAFSKTKTRIGIMIFFNFDFPRASTLRAPASVNLTLTLNSPSLRALGEIVTLASATGRLTVTSWLWT